MTLSLASFKFSFRYMIGLLIFCWLMLLAYQAQKNETNVYKEDINKMKSIIMLDEKEQMKAYKINLPNMLKLMSNVPPLQSNESEFGKICPLRKNVCVKNKHWLTSNKSDMFDARSSIRYCKGIICNSLRAEYAKANKLSKCSVYNNISMVLLGQYYPHMFSHVWSRTLNGLWQYSMRRPLLSKDHHFVFEQLDFEPMFMFHQMLLRPFSNYPVQHYKNLLFDPKNALFHMSQLKLLNGAIDKSDSDDNCACVKEVYFCGFNQDFSTNYPQGFLTPNNGNYFSWDRMEWIKAFWYQQSDGYNENDRIRFIEEYFEKQRLNESKIMIGLIDRKKHGKWLNIDKVANECNDNRTTRDFVCKIVRIYEFKRPIELLWIMNEIDILIGFHSNSLAHGGLWLPHKASIVEILPSNPIPSWMNFPGSTLQWIFRKIPQRHVWFQLLDGENHHIEDYNADKTDFKLAFDELTKVINVLLTHPNEFCYDYDHSNISVPLDLEKRNFTLDTKDFDTQSILFQYKPKCLRVD